MAPPQIPGGGTPPGPPKDLPAKMGVGSEIETAEIVQQLVQAERAPTEQRLARREEAIQEQVSALGQMRGLLSDFREGVQGLADPADYTGIEAASRNPDVVEVSAAEDADTGRFDVQVQQLATTQRLASQEGLFESSSEPVGTGRMDITLANGERQSVAIDEDSRTLLGIRDAINQQTEGVRASIVDDGQGPRLTFATTETGRENAITEIRTVQEEGDQGDLSMLQFVAPRVNEQGEEVPAQGGIQQVRAARDAVAIIDGLEVRRSGNEIEGAIRGATLQLHDTGETSVEISRQQGLAEENVQNFVELYNQVRTQLNELSAYDPDSGEAGPLQSDSTLRGVQTRLARALTDPLESLERQPVQSMADLGVTTNRDGTISLDSQRLQQAAREHPELLVHTLTNEEDGVIPRMDRVLDEAVGRDSTIDMRTEGLERRLQSIEDDRDRLDRRMERVEERLTRQFSAMDSAVAEMNQTSEFIEQRLAALNQD